MVKRIKGSLIAEVCFKTHTHTHTLTDLENEALTEEDNQRK